MLVSEYLEESYNAASLQKFPCRVIYDYLLVTFFLVELSNANIRYRNW